MPFIDEMSNAVLHDCQCMKEPIKMSSSYIGAVLVTSVVFGYFCGIGVRKTAKKIIRAVEESKQ